MDDDQVVLWDSLAAAAAADQAKEDAALTTRPRRQGEDRMIENDSIVLQAMKDFEKAETNGEKAACVRFLAARFAAADALRNQARQEIADILNGKIPMVADPIFDPIETRKAIRQVSLTAAAALAVVAQRISDNAFTGEDGPEFVIRPEDKCELDDALCEYREACDK